MTDARERCTIPGMEPLKYQHRVVHAEFRAAPDGVEGRFTARVLVYNVVDDYRTTFKPGVFADSLKKRMPRIVWGHDWREPLGVYTRAIDNDKSLTLVGQLDDFDAVPRAKQAWAQLQSGTIDEFSVGFMPEDAIMELIDGDEVLAFTRGRLDEASLVLTGAVPDTGLVGLRSGLHVVRPVIVRSPTVELAWDDLADVLASVEAGELDAVAAAEQIKTLSAPAATEDHEDTETGDGEPPAEPPAGDATEPESTESADDEQHEPEATGDGSTEQVDEQVEVDAELEAEIEAALALVEGVK